ncbi:beta-N-acetylhexosaminidase [Thalassotalea atypica]|uniref:beta-N-acetylhexosaminidase n=1 Tax=Thalassotalea atypica TaxID=2054316 RepID=UPI00257477E0|nr:beta-N-acetylhexosaminidase [Thalassotalea atypica]
MSLILCSFSGIASDSIQQDNVNKANDNCLTLMPCPKQLIKADGSFMLTQAPKLFVSGMSEKRQHAALKRFTEQVKRVPGFAFQGFIPVEDSDLADVKLIIESGNNAEQGNYLPQLGDNESYQLTITKAVIHIEAVSDFGALHALTSLLQIISIPELSATVTQKKFLTLPAIQINDQPRFQWRGLLIDSVRHFIPLNAIKRQLDGMAAAKLNVFHWHLTDDQGWRIESKTYPKLHLLASDGLYYTQQEIKELVTYANNLGIRVVPEFDLPGHASAIAVAYPELIAEKNNYVAERQWGVFEPLLDITNPKTYQFIEAVITELTDLFPDEYLHIGGDEVNPKQWLGSKDVRALMLKHNLKDADDVQSFFNVKLQKILSKHKRKMMGWDEIHHEDLPQDIVVQSWRGLESLNRIAGSGYQALLSAGFYIDQPQATAYHYRNDPLANIALASQKANEILQLQMQNAEQWRTWSFTMPRLKGSAVKGSLTLISNEKNNKFIGYLKLNEHHHKEVAIHSSLQELQDNQVVFSHDSWMGPMRFELSLSAAGALSGFTLLGNSYYPIEPNGQAILGEVKITLQPLLAIEQAKNILGGEATLWSELVDEQNIDLRTWPRLFAIAERFWSPESLKDSDDMYHRLMIIDDYAADIIGLQHQEQLLAGFTNLIAKPSEKHQELAALVTLAEALEPAHYYTRHHLKYQKHQYHQNAALNNFVDYLPVESYSLIMMRGYLREYKLGDKSALLKLEKKFLSWQENAKKLSMLITQNGKLSSLSAVVSDLQKFNRLASTIVEGCMSDNFYHKKSLRRLDNKLLALQQKSKEIVIAAVPLARSLLKHCQMTSE